MKLKKNKEARTSIRKKSRVYNRYKKDYFKKSDKMASLFLSPGEFKALKTDMKKYL